MALTDASSAGVGARAGSRVGALKLLRAALFSRIVRAVRGVALARLLSPDSAFRRLCHDRGYHRPDSSLSNVGLTGFLAREPNPSDSLIATARWVNRAVVVTAGLTLFGAVTGWALASGHTNLLGPGIAVALATAIYFSPQVPLGLLQQRKDFHRLANWTWSSTSYGQ